MENHVFLIYDGHDNHITISCIIHCMKNNIIFMVLLRHSSHLSQSLDVEVFDPLKILMASTIESLISIELHRIFKVEWFSVYVEAHDNVCNVITFKIERISRISFFLKSAEDYIYNLTHRVMATVAIYNPIYMIKLYIL